MEKRESAGGYEYVVPARTLRGSVEEVLAEIDEAVEGLLALRQLVARRLVSRPGGAAHRSWVPAAGADVRPGDR